MTYLNHISKFEDLITSYDETRAGFIAIALEKNHQATPFVEEARILQNRIKNVATPGELPHIKEIRNGIIAAAGISDKAAGHLGVDGCTQAIQEFIKNFLLPAGEKFKEELVFRFLLTKGDSLGGKMRNIVGVLAQRKLCLSIVSALRLWGMPFFAFNDSEKHWLSSGEIENDTEIENAKGLSWTNAKGDERTLYFNINIPVVKNNIDIILVNKPHTEPIKQIVGNSKNYVALGELKGGIDPAGADEHWKTAKAALDRIRAAFVQQGLYPSLFFIDAAIENKMAVEIYSNLLSRNFANAANLTKGDHIASLVGWLISL